MQPENVFPSVEALQARQKADQTSLGLVQPGEVLEIRADAVAKAEKDSFRTRYEEAVRQMDLPLDPDTGREIRPLRGADYRFTVRFRCTDATCQGHEFSILDWEMDALYFRLRTERQMSPQLAAQGVVDKLRDQVLAPDKDLHFFLGNFHQRPWVFSIVGLWWPKRKKPEPPARPFFQLSRSISAG